MICMSKAMGFKQNQSTWTSDEQEKCLHFLIHAAESDHPSALFALDYFIFENAQSER